MSKLVNSDKSFHYLFQEFNTEQETGIQVLATKTYYTTSTYYTTLIDASNTVTKTRTKIKSSIVTETYSGGLEDGYEAGPNVRPTAAYLPASGEVSNCTNLIFSATVSKSKANLQ